MHYQLSHMALSAAVILLAPLLYLITSAWLAVRLFKPHQAAASSSLASLLFLSGLLLHGYVLWQSIPAPAGYYLGFYHAFSLMSWVVVCMVFVIGLFRSVAGLGVIFLPVASVSIILQHAFPNTALVVAADTVGTQLHILLSVTAYSVLTITAMQALVLHYQQRSLHNKKPNQVLNILPPMQYMEAFLIHSLAIGFFLLSLSLVTGLVFVHNIVAQHLAHKVFFSLLAWCTFGIVLWGRWARGWRGRKLLHWILGGFTSLVLAYFGTKAVLDLLLDRV